ncbi:MAG: metal-dependent transcriptional regulator [Firmicutes bacterium]|nr:metal-dependent transcriptional regulator [Bacillota bacterium]MBQ2059043.1 metal-dependent transcriptional regulator [Bacillota bacterium]MBQ4371285.1 metal-dependent transcriptional regulator [Bacillota bacterium]
MKNTREDYLEMILDLKNEKGYIRSVDIAAGLGVTRASVSYAVKRLREDGLITMDDAGMIEFTPEGLQIAERTMFRHQMLTSILMSMGVSEDAACDDACAMEHILSEESFGALLRFAQERDLPVHHHDFKKHVHHH